MGTMAAVATGKFRSRRPLPRLNPEVTYLHAEDHPPYVSAAAA